jgi:YVTN family beta-propeller protein
MFTKTLLLPAVVATCLGCSHSDHEGDADDEHHDGNGDGDGDGDGDQEQPDGGTLEAIPGPAILIANGGSGSVHIIDPSTLKVASSTAVDEGMHPHHIGVAPHGKHVLITATSADLSAGHGTGEHGGHGAAATTTVYQLDLASGKLEGALEIAATAHNAAYTKDGKTIVVGMMEHGMIAAYDAATREEVFSVTGLAAPLEVTATNVGSLLVAESGAARVAVIDLATRAITTRFEMGAVPVAAWASGSSDYFVSVEEGKELRHIVEADGSVTMDAHTITPNGMPGQAVLTPDGGELWVAVEDRGVLAIFDAESHESIAELEAGTKPHGIVFEPGGARAFVTDEGGGAVLVIDVAARSVASQIDVGGKPNGIAWLTP